MATSLRALSPTEARRFAETPPVDPRDVVLSIVEQRAADTLAGTISRAKLKGSGTSTEIEAAETVLATLDRLSRKLAGEGAA